MAFKVYRQDVEEILADDSLDERFCDEPLDEHVARVASDLALEFPPDAIARWRDLPDPPKALLDPE